MDFVAALERACAVYKAHVDALDVYKTPRAWAEAAFNLKRFTVFPSCGHFAALEEPEALVGDIRAFFRELR